MKEADNRKPNSGRTYSGKTIVLSQDQHKRSSRSVDLPNVPPVSAESTSSPGHAADRVETLRKQKRQQKLDIKTLRRRIWLGIRIALLVILIVGIGGAAFLYQQTHAMANVIVVPEVRPNPSIATPFLSGTNVLIVGVDERPNHPEEGVRSDTLILAHLDAGGRWINLLSIPRDTQVELPGIGITKINVAYGQGYAFASELYGAGTTPQQGGMALAAETVEQFLGLPPRGMRVDYTAQVNFDGFVHVIDALGGVTIDVQEHIIDDTYPTENFGTMYVEFLPGEQRMDGQTALIYARTRNTIESDYGRSKRQQQVMQAIVAEIRHKGWFGRVATMPALLDSFKGEQTGNASASAGPVLTTMPIDRPDVLLGLLVLASGLEPDAIGQIRISPETVVLQAEYGSNLVWDPAGIQDIVTQTMRQSPRQQ